MAVRTLATGDLDTEIAQKIHEVLTAGPVTQFRELLLDTISDNIQGLYRRSEEEDDIV